MNATFDTNILIDYLRGIALAKSELLSYEKKFISVVTWMEVLVGAKNKEEEAIISNFLSMFELIPLTETIALLAVKIRRTTKLKLPDAIVLATSRAQGTILVTRNTKDFNAEEPEIRVPYKIGG